MVKASLDVTRWGAQEAWDSIDASFILTGEEPNPDPNAKMSARSLLILEGIKSACIVHRLKPVRITATQVYFLAAELVDWAKEKSFSIPLGLDECVNATSVAFLKVHDARKACRPEPSVPPLSPEPTGGVLSVEDARKLAGAELYADFAEYINNGALIDWAYWVDQMPTWTAKEASRLLNGLDPDVFDGAQPKPNDHDTSAEELAAMRALRLATALGITSDTPENWFSWAKARDMRAHEGLLLALRTRALSVADGDSGLSCGVECAESPVHLSAGYADKPPKPLPALRAQEAKILEWLKQNEYTPDSLPPNESGKPGIKAAVRTALKDHDLFKNRATVFDKAWYRLRSGGELK
ncbi:hypothetical protein F2P45_32260 [Massilia sp. CCM 8733]|uniref:Uncharacterized protein n=1 Tax=Massilia mucilaginosa TaxID=2609282 RepID=A0ABX0P2U0_9BURK|nr:hypothetical protein [Massilia mucilaginosa]NHZ93638.1 hypothetical protein [Massilia mucilaginosa]